MAVLRGSAMLLGVVFLSILMTAGAFDYCSVNCTNGGQHVLCGPGDRNNACGEYKSGLSSDEQEDLVAELNRLRQKIARANGTNLPPAADMMEVTWDDELARMAQRFLETCKVGIDRCRITSDNGTAGETYMSGNYYPAKKYTRKQLLKIVLHGWYAPIEIIDPVIIKSFNSSSPTFNTTGLATQLIWAKTTHVGCGLLFLQSWSGRRALHRENCYYKPAGNFNAHPIYQQGEACSKCPDGSVCSSKYPGLCKA